MLKWYPKKKAIARKTHLTEWQELWQANKCYYFSAASLIKNNIFNLYLHDATAYTRHFTLPE